MKMKDRKSLHDKSITELKNLVSKARESLLDFNLDKTQNKLKNTSQIPLKKREIAIMLTILKEKELSKVKPVEAKPMKGK